MRSVMYWKVMRHTIRRNIKSCQSCQINKRHSQKYGHVPPKLVQQLFGKRYVLTSQVPTVYGLSIHFMCLTMINPATSWFEIVELPTVTELMTVPTTGKDKKVTFAENTKMAETTFVKISAKIRNLVYKTWFSRYLYC